MQEAEKAASYLSDILQFRGYFTLEEISKETGFARDSLQRALVKLQHQGWGFKEENFTAYRRRFHSSPVCTYRKKDQKNSYDPYEPDWEPSLYHVTTKPKRL